MTEAILPFVGIFILSVFVSSCSQIMLKSSANKVYDSRIKEYLNPLVISAYALFFMSTLVTIYALRYVPLSLGAVLEASGYIFVGVLGYFILKERMTPLALAGMALIVTGIIICVL